MTRLPVWLGWCAALLLCGPWAVPGEAVTGPASVEAALQDRAVPVPEAVRTVEALIAAGPHAAELERRLIMRRVELMLEDGRLAGAAAEIERLVALSESARDELSRARAFALRARLGYYRGDAALALRSSELAVASARTAGDPRTLALAYEQLGLALDSASRYEEAAEALHTGLEAARRSEDPGVLAGLYRSLSGLNISLRDYGRALEYADQAERQADRANDRWLLVSLDIARSIAHGEAGRPEQDRAMLERARQGARRYGLLMAEQTVLVNLSDWYLRREAWPQAIDHARQALAVAARFDAPYEEGTAYVNLGLALLGAGRTADGIRELERGVGYFRQARERAAYVETLPDLARAYEQAGRVRDALDALKRFREEKVLLEEQTRGRVLAEMQERFDARQRQREIEHLQTENAARSAAAARQRQLTALALGAASLLTVFFVVIAWLFARTRRAKLALEGANARLAFLAERDPLTGLLNRRAMQSWLALHTEGTGAGAALAFLLIDIDHFKQINDRFGHAAGDAVIVEFAERLNRLLREDDRLARWGGEEFLVVLQGIAPQDLARFADRLLVAVGGRAFAAVEGGLPVSCSIGFCPWPIGEGGWESHVAMSDRALYLAKSRGRNTACGLLALRSPWATVRRALEEDFAGTFLSGAIESAIVRGPALPAGKVVSIKGRPGGA